MRINDIEIKLNNDEKNVDITFKFFFKIDYKNLFLLAKFYLDSKNLPLSFLIIAKKDDIERVPVFHNIFLKKIKKISFVDFIDLIDTLLNEDYKYVQNYNYYGFRIYFEKESFIFKENYFPKIPWEENFKNAHITEDRLKYKLKNEIKTLKLKIWKLKKIKKYLKYL